MFKEFSRVRVSWVRNVYELAEDVFGECCVMSQPVGQPGPSGKSIPTSISVGLILITIISLALVGYTALNSHVATLTQQQFVTNTQNLYNTQTQTVTSIGTQTVTSIGTATSVTTAMITTTAGYGYGNYQNCGYYGCYNANPGYYFNGNYYTTCQSTGSGYTVQCSGYLYQPGNGCVVLAVPINNGYWFENRVYQYYTLQNLPSYYTLSWRWVTVTGQLYQGYNTAPSGANCPGNYITVSSISP